ncbi:hypothetical protein BKA67DRAFT_659568 [Truncatella angustata]|uniref:Uncharacterized protein n=1 Tax=Truncatella angustata TaxID=152316 RepID=A0A9P8ZXE2_9PEZI|nr:uncharacterized protein BKA67DRAFT_659568 [Truncatella angustata]KAH6652909.1 hypothetical protein BKA67DRAFT_659568 [Truncatella angustata]KAH8197224.1 hypothetical protein TruAng_008611 [Truncatella angustata]
MFNNSKIKLTVFSGDQTSATTPFSICSTRLMAYQYADDHNPVDKTQAEELKTIVKPAWSKSSDGLFNVPGCKTRVRFANRMPDTPRGEAVPTVMVVVDFGDKSFPIDSSTAEAITKSYQKTRNFLSTKGPAGIALEFVDERSINIKGYEGAACWIAE